MAMVTMFFDEEKMKQFEELSRRLSFDFSASRAPADVKLAAVAYLVETQVFSIVAFKDIVDKDDEGAKNSADVLLDALLKSFNEKDGEADGV